MPEFVEVILNILTSGLPCAVLALGIFVTFTLLDFPDMTAEGSFLIGGALCLSLIKVGCNAFLAAPVGALGGAVCGLITAFLHTKLKIPKLLSGIITMTATTSLAMVIMGISSANNFENLVTLSVKDITVYQYFYISGAPMFNPVIEASVMLVIVVAIILVIYFFFGTEYGMAIRAVGINEKMSKAQGINSDLCIIVGVTISNFLIALAGALYAMDARSMELKSASGFLVVGLASILIGQAIFGRRSFKNSIISITLGAIIYYVIIVVAIRVGFPTELKYLLYAILITIALCVPFIKKFFKWLIKKLTRKENVSNA